MIFFFKIPVRGTRMNLKISINCSRMALSILGSKEPVKLLAPSIKESIVSA